MPKRKHRVIIDTNLWISFLLTKNFSKLDNVFADQTLTLLFSQELLDEFIEVARRPKFKRYFSLADLQALVEQISLRAEFVTVTSEITICRDPKDNFLLALATDAKASHLITGDKDLLDLQQFENTAIMTIATYLSGK
ncbi:putative toxin-antitoxin system toxin component, PIN family [Larkinella punicea]|uniref:Putative toxin-antitoxin system toxin component, PIN family n=1 Tax=Larkinella punicea TaxID=2315727 RepID=A0A368JJP0_9BACT|nr:putative toxin-antitoxin system toxin component, PIN family [Larkinella punicea]RCR67879.1 putative toxin-antitoxin system toxin component, PIN family [Larkinella punicea]